MKLFAKSNDIEFKFNVIDIVLFMALIFQDAGTFGVLPLNAFQIIILCMTGMLFLKQIYVSRKKVFLSKKLLIIFAYMMIVTIVFGRDLESLKSLVYFFIQCVTLYWYIRTVDDYRKIFRIIYLASFVLAAYGLVQEIAFVIGIPELYDTSLYGFMVNGSYITSFGLIRCTSLYAEPAHLSAIVAAGVLIGLVGKDENYSFVKNTRTLIIMLCGILTMSVVVYASVLIVVIVYIVVFQRDLLRKMLFLLIFPVIIGVFVITNQEIASFILEKLGSLQSGSSTQGSDLSAFAIYSNLEIAIEKIKDGYVLGTGFDSHRIYYFKYIHELYNSVLMYANSEEAASLYIRILSEFGIVGFCFFVIWLFRHLFNSIKKRDNIFIVFSLILSVQAIRSGQYAYILASLPFVVLCSTEKDKNQINMKSRSGVI